MATTFCLINQKGGCGKSSTCFHLAGAFSAFGLKVLLVDVDPQGSLSQGFLGPTLVESLPAGDTVALLFDEPSFLADQDHLIRHTEFDRICLCPANQSLSPFNTPNPEPDDIFQFILREFLQEQSSAFDVVLIDCPPNLYRCSWAAMLAADHVIIPVPPEDFGTQGLRAVHRSIDHVQRLNHGLRLLGHLVTRFDRRLLIHRSYESRLRDLYGDRVLDTVIPEASAFKVALACRKPVEMYSSQTLAASLTRKLGREILDRVVGTRSSLKVA